MPPANRISGSGCLVTGVYLSPGERPEDGKIVFQPQHGGMDPTTGVVYSDRNIAVTPSAENGAWSVLLAPSSVVGTYSVQFGATLLTAIVPNTPSAKFAEIAEARK